MKILDLELYTSDIGATRLFYACRLGLPVLSRSETHLTVLIGWTRLTFRLIGQPVAPYHLAINVPRGSLEVVMYYFDFDYLAPPDAGVDARDKTIVDFPNGGAQACYSHDGNGNLLEFIARTDLPLDDPNLTINELFQGISEIGMVTEDVAHATGEIQRRFGVSQAKTTPAPDCNALGDDNGLFILARVGRYWRSNTPAGLNYCRVQFSNESGGGVHELYSYEVNRLPIGKGTEPLGTLASTNRLRY